MEFLSISVKKQYLYKDAGYINQITLTELLIAQLNNEASQARLWCENFQSDWYEDKQEVNENLTLYWPQYLQGTIRQKKFYPLGQHFNGTIRMLENKQSYPSNIILHSILLSMFVTGCSH